MSKDSKRTIQVYATPQNVDKCLDDLGAVLFDTTSTFDVQVFDVTADPSLAVKANIAETPTLIIEAPGFLGVISPADSTSTIRSALGIRQG